MVITIVSCSDWSAVFFDNDNVTEGHSVRYDELLDELKRSKEIVEDWRHKIIKDEWVEEYGGSFPDKYSDIPEEAFII